MDTRGQMETYPGGMHHALGRPGGARREQDEERVAEGQLLELQLRCLLPSPGRKEVVQKHAVGEMHGTNRERLECWMVCEPSRTQSPSAPLDESLGSRGNQPGVEALPGVQEKTTSSRETNSVSDGFS